MFTLSSRSIDSRNQESSSSYSSYSSYSSVAAAEEQMYYIFRNNSRQKAIDLLFANPCCFSSFPPEYQENIEMRKTAFLAARLFGPSEICQRLLMSEGVAGPLVAFNGLLSRNWRCFETNPIDRRNFVLCSRDFKMEKVVAEFLVRQDGMILQDLPDVFRDDLGLVWNATQNNVRAAAFCSERLRRYFGLGSRL